MCAGAAAGGLGLAGGGVALMATGTPAWVPAALAVAGAAAAGGLIGSGYQTGQRTRLTAAASSTVAALLGLPGPIRASGRPVAAARLWRGSGVGSPRLVALHVPRQLSLDDADHAELATAVSSVFGASYRCARRSRGRLLLHRYTPVPTAPIDPVVARIRRIVAELFGAAARVDGVQLTGGDVRGFRVGFDSSTRVNNAPWRAKAERHVSVMLPGRWRAHWDLEHDRVRFEVRPTLPEVVAHPVPGGRVAATRELPIGVDEDGGPVTWRLKVAPHLLITGPTGRGKALALDTPIRTPSGWTEMGSLQTGDTLFDENGAPCRVTAAHPVMIGRPCHEVLFSDGSKIVADAEHLWATTTRAERIQSAAPPHGTPGYTPHQIAAVDRVRSEADREPDRQVSCAQVIGEIGKQYLPLVYKLARQLTPTSTVRSPFTRRDARSELHNVQHLSFPAAGYSRQLLLKVITTHMATPTNASRVVAHDRIVTTEEISATLRTGPGVHANHAVAVAGALQLPTRDLPMDPYLLGVWLGDGATHNATVFSADQPIVAAFTVAGYPVVKDKSDPYYYRIGGGFRAQLRQLGVLRNKHIPRQYLDADTTARQQLLAGLLDTDGWVEPPRGHRYGTTSPCLLKGVLDLAHGLGLQTRVTTRTVRGRSPATSTFWTVKFTADQPMFRLARKRNRIAPGLRRDTGRRRYIVGVHAVTSVPVRCITVDSPNHLYLAGKTLIPTHNTVAINGVVAEATAAGWCVRIVDPKRIEFLALRGWSNVEIVATRVVDMIATIGATHRLMEQRYEQIEAGEASEDEFEPVILVLDEYRDLQSMVDFWWVSELKAAVGTKVKVPTKCPVYEWVGSIARKGRSADVHLVIGLQRPDAEFLTGEMRDNFTARLSLGRLSPQGAMMMWEAPHIGVAIPGIRGRGTANGGDRDIPVEVQTYWTPDPRRNRSTADRELLRQLWPGQAQHRPREVVVEDLSEDGTGLWKAIQHAELAPVPDDRLPAGPFAAEPSGDADNRGALHDAQLGADEASPADGAASPQPNSVDDQQDTDTGTAAVGAAAPSSRGLWPPVGRRIRRTGPVEGDGDAVVLALPTRGRDAPAPAPAPERPEPPRGADDGDQADDTEVDGQLYGAAEPVSLAELVPGDLLEADIDGTPAWVVVAEVEPDVDDDGSYCVEYRADDGTDGQLVLPDDCLVQRRSARV